MPFSSGHDRAIRTFRSDVFRLLTLAVVLLLALTYIARADGDGPQSVSKQASRTTSFGWEYANSLSVPSATSASSATNESPQFNHATNLARYLAGDSSGWLTSIHHCMLPVAVAIFLLTFGSWLLLALPNHAISTVSDGTH